MNDLNINGQIIDRCKNGEVKAQFILYKQYSKAMYNIAIRFLYRLLSPKLQISGSGQK